MRLSLSTTVDDNQTYILIYKLYGIPCINLFLMVSTWLIVVMSINRYLVIVYPLHVRFMLSANHTAIIILSVYISSAIITLPHFMASKITQCLDLNRRLQWETKPLFTPATRDSIYFYMTKIWPAIASFVPVLILAVCNVCLIRQLSQAKSSRKRSVHGQAIRDSSHKITLTLVIIVLMLLFLSSPSEILRYINPYDSWGHAGHTIATFANTLQTINFAFNFILYCALSASFRHTFKAMFMRCFSQQGSRIEIQQMLAQGTTTNGDKSTTTNGDRIVATDTEVMVTHGSASNKGKVSTKYVQPLSYC